MLTTVLAVCGVLLFGIGIAGWMAMILTHHPYPWEDDARP